MVKIDERPPYKSFLDEDQYQEEKLRLSTQKPQKEEYIERERRPPRRIEIERRTIHKMIGEAELEPLRRVGPKVIGNLFDRVEFLKQRMSENRVALETRKRLHQELLDEIETDIKDKNRILETLSNVDDIRDFKLDISTLRMERRRENVLFWRDILELTTELRELMEEYQMESKIANLFKELQPGV